MLGDDRVDERLHRVVVADIAGMELVRQPVDRPPRTRHDRRTLVGEDGADAGADPSHAAGHEDDSTAQLQVDTTVSRVGHCASVPSKCLLR